MCILGYAHHLARGLALLLILATGAWAAQPISSAPTGDDPPLVLVLHSYHKGFRWTDSLEAGIRETLAQALPKARVLTEYMDTKRYLDPGHMENLLRLYGHKYARQRPDLIISSDDNAFTFLRLYGRMIFGSTPFVFCGVNYFQDDMLDGLGGCTGVVEDLDLHRTLALALALHPNTRHIAVVVDRTPTGRSTARGLAQLPLAYAQQYNFLMLEDLTMPDLLRRVGSLPGDSLVLLLNFNRDRDGRVYDHLETIQLLGQASKVPIWGMWDFFMGRGIVGGMITSGRSQGAAAAELALRILGGEDASSIGVVKQSPNQWMFDYRQLVRFGLSPTALPPESIIVNRPPSFYEVNKTIIWSLTGALLFLGMTTVVLAMNIVQRRRAQTELGKVNRALRALSQSNQCLVQDDIESELLIDICRVIVETGGYQLAWVGYPEPDLPEHVRLVAHWSAGGQAEPGRVLSEDPVTEAWADLRAGRPYHIRRPRLGAGSEGWVGASIALPLTHGRRTYGLLHIHAPEADAFHEEEVRLLGELADNLSYGLGALAAARDRATAQAELRDTAEKLAALLESLPIVPFTAAPQLGGPFTYVSGAVIDITGFQPRDFLDDPDFWDRHLHPDDRCLVLERLAEEGPAAERLTYRFRTENGDYRWFSDTRRLISYPDNGLGRIVGFWQDITPEVDLRQEAERRLQQVIQADKLASLGELVAGVAHEIRNPNSFISTNVPLLRETWELLRPVVDQAAARDRAGLDVADLSRDMNDMLDDIMAGSERIDRVVRELREFASSSEYSQPQPVHLNQVVHKALTLVGAQVRKTFTHFVLELDPELPLVEGHPTKLEQVVANLVVNATHAVRPGVEAVLKISTGRLAEPPAVLLHVEDNGQGIPPELRERIFEPFFTTRREVGGTGLGLSVSYRLVRDHQGAISLVSRPGRGSRFTVALPCQPGSPLEMRPALLWVDRDPARLERLAALAQDPPTPRLLGLDQPQAMAERLAQRPQVVAVCLALSSLDGQVPALLEQLAQARPLLTRTVYAGSLARRQAEQAAGPLADAVVSGPLTPELLQHIMRLSVKNIL